MKKRWIILGLVMVMIISTCLVGCASKTEELAPAEGAVANQPAIPRPEGVPADYPNKTITYIFPFGGGGSIDAFSQAVFAKMKELGGWDERIMTETREGGGGLVGWAAIADADPDGYKFGFTASPQLQLPISSELCTWTADSYAHIGNFVTDPGAIAVVADSEINTLAELLEASKTKKLTIGTTGLTTSEARAIMQFQQADPEVQLEIIPYTTEPEVVVAVRGGHIDAACLNVGNLFADSEQGNVKVIATGGTVRSPLFPEIETYREQGYAVTQFSMRSYSFPAGTDQAIVDYMHELLVAALQSEEVIEVGDNLGFVIDEQVYDDAELTEIWVGLSDELQALWDVAPWE